MEFDTGSNESGHKVVKKAAKLTQRCKEMFDRQTAKRMEELTVLQLAEMEFNGKLLWNYYDCKETMVTTTEIPATSTIMGGELCVVYNQDNDINKVFMCDDLTVVIA